MNQFTTINNTIFAYTPTTDLTKGTHIPSFTVQKDQPRNTLISTGINITSLPKQPGFKFPWIIAIIIAIIISIVGLVLYYLKSQAFI